MGRLLETGEGLEFENWSEGVFELNDGFEFESGEGLKFDCGFEYCCSVGFELGDGADSAFESESDVGLELEGWSDVGFDDGISGLDEGFEPDGEFE